MARDAQITKTLTAELSRQALAMAPIWVIGLTDTEGKLGDALARLEVMDERASATEQDRFRRFIAEERDQLQSHLRRLAEAALRARSAWVAGFAQAPAVPMRKTALQIFQSVYPRPLPFPFDGFSSQAGNGPRDLAVIAKALIQGEVSQAWIPAQPSGRRNRIQGVLAQSWQALDTTNAPCGPREPTLQQLYQSLECAHQQDSNRSLATSYQMLINPPHGMNAASATLLLALLIGLPRPQRGLIYQGQPINGADWVAIAFPKVRAKHYFDEAVLIRTQLQLFDEDAETRWLRFLDDWEAETRLDQMAKRLKEASERLRNEPVPPSLTERLARLRVEAEEAGTALLQKTVRLQALQRQIEKAVTKDSLHHGLRYGCEVAEVRAEISDTDRWPEKLTRECDPSPLFEFDPPLLTKTDPPVLRERQALAETAPPT